MVSQGIYNALYNLNVPSIRSQDNDKPINISGLFHTFFLYRGAHYIVDSANEWASERECVSGEVFFQSNKSLIELLLDKVVRAQGHRCIHRQKHTITVSFAIVALSKASGNLLGQPSRLRAARMPMRPRALPSVCSSVYPDAPVSSSERHKRLGHDTRAAIAPPSWQWQRPAGYARHDSSDGDREVAQPPFVARTPLGSVDAEAIQRCGL